MFRQPASDRGSFLWPNARGVSGPDSFFSRLGKASNSFSILNSLKPSGTITNVITKPW